MCALRAMASPLAFSLRAQIEIWMCVCAFISHALMFLYDCLWSQMQLTEIGKLAHLQRRTRVRMCVYVYCTLHPESSRSPGEREIEQLPRILMESCRINAISDHFISNHVLLKADVDPVGISITLILVSVSGEEINFPPDVGVDNIVVWLPVTALS